MPTVCLAEIKKASKTSESDPSAYRRYVRVRFALRLCEHREFVNGEMVMEKKDLQIWQPVFAGFGVLLHSGKKVFMKDALYMAVNFW